MQDETEAVAKADKEIADATLELSRLEAMTPRQEDVAPSNSLDSLEKSFSTVLSELSSSDYVKAELVRETKEYMCKLMAGLKTLAVSVQAAQSQSQSLPSQMNNTSLPTAATKMKTEGHSQRN